MNSLTQDIKAISSVFDKYSSKTDEIGLYIITAEEQKDFVETVDIKPETTDYIDRLRKLSNSVVLYNAAIISIYGSYELFLDEILKAYIGYLKKRYPEYAEFPDRLKRKHMQKGAEFLTNPQRYTNMGFSEQKIISALEASCIQGQSLVLIDELLISHGGNLKSKQFIELLQECGFSDPIPQLLNHVSFGVLCLNDGPIYSDATGVFPVLDQLVEERNKVGHGWIIENRLSFSLLRETTLRFFVELCRAVKDMIVSQIIQDYIADNYIEPFDPIIHVWNDGYIVGINSKNFKLKVDESLFFSTGNNWNYPLQIKNIQKDNIDRKEIRSQNVEVALQTDKRIKQNYTLYGFVRKQEET